MIGWLAGKVWALKMLVLWRVRLGYWDFDAFRASLKYARGLDNSNP